MSMSDNAPRPVWRRAAAAPRVAEEEARPLTCGGGLSVDETYLIMKERRAKRKAEEARLRGDSEEKRAPKRTEDDEDEERAAERFRNDRYSVKLLQQDNDAWGGGGAGSGVLG